MSYTPIPTTLHHDSFEIARRQAIVDKELKRLDAPGVTIFDPEFLTRDEDFESMCVKIRAKQCTDLRWVVLLHCYRVTNEQLVALAEALEDYGRVYTLSIGHGGLQLHAYGTLLNVTALKRLNLVRLFHFSEADAESLAAGLGKLKMLVFYKTPLSSRSCRILVEAMRPSRVGDMFAPFCDGEFRRMAARATEDVLMIEMDSV